MKYSDTLKVEGQLENEEAGQDFFTCHNPEAYDQRDYAICNGDCTNCQYKDSRLREVTQ